jgi:hypothetical protein
VLASRGETWIDDPRLKDVAVDIVRSLVNADDPALGVDWTERSNLQANVRLRIKRVLRKHRTFIPSYGGGLEDVAERVFQQARLLYERWPEIDGERWW